jgi:glycine betaine/proline transport system substrate-binding protein
VRLEEPAFDPAKYKALQPSEDPNWYENSKVMTEDALKKVQIAYSKSLAERSPAITDLLKNIKLTGEDVSNFAFQIESGKSADQVAKEWVAANSDRVDSWLGL